MSVSKIGLFLALLSVFIINVFLNSLPGKDLWLFIGSVLDTKLVSQSSNSISNYNTLIVSAAFLVAIFFSLFSQILTSIIVIITSPKYNYEFSESDGRTLRHIVYFFFILMRIITIN
jgi:hypothetical protein